MTAVFRIVHTRYAEQALTGEGTRRRGSRWTRPGMAAVYASETLSLAMLELYVHVEERHARRMPLVYFRMELPADAPTETLRPQDLPHGWNAYPYPPRVQEVGTRWLERGSSLALHVPSVIIPTERNVILNPAHPVFARMRVDGPHPLALDKRLP